MRNRHALTLLLSLPTTPAPVGAPPFEAVFTRRKDHAAAGLDYEVEFSADLGAWTASTEEPDVVAAGGSGPVTGGGPQKTPNFFRVAVTAN